MKPISKFCIAALIPLLSFSSSGFAVESATTTQTAIEQSAQGKVVWADLYTGDVQSSLDFYTRTFGWTVKAFEQHNRQYHLMYDGEQPIAGVIKRPAERNQTNKSLWIGSVATSNVQTSVDNAVAHNATIVFPPHDFALYGKRAVIADPQGAIIAFLDLGESSTAHQAIAKKWDWAQLFSVNPEKAAEFYQHFGYSTEQIAANSQSYYLIKEQELRASIVKLPASAEQRDKWINFVEVANLAAVLQQAIANGATLLHQGEDAQLAIIADPNGAILGLAEQEAN
ncbi:VOC family protein [Pseudoalteromonas shioyasakiensis]|uniref:VOC family protein n=1 Tax=Pseudoalteromonas shioyasakiensis TaxID=1190813 RepID=UPI0021190568|nr:VOC family protein [Pseudoalteromonas shioyasakiensis]MCQ8878478.1 VOC family protein [Pseudoalteromonas shioyasakiensis]